MKIISTGKVKLEMEIKVIPKSDENKVINVMFGMLLSQGYDAENIKIEREPEPLVCPPKEE